MAPLSCDSSVISRVTLAPPGPPAGSPLGQGSTPNLVQFLELTSSKVGRSGDLRVRTLLCAQWAHAHRTLCTQRAQRKRRWIDLVRSCSCGACALCKASSSASTAPSSSTTSAPDSVSSAVDSFLSDLDGKSPQKRRHHCNILKKE